MLYKHLYTGETVELVGKTREGRPVIRSGGIAWASCYNLLEKVPQQVTVKVKFDKCNFYYTCEAEELPVGTVVFHKVRQVFGIVTEVITDYLATKAAKDHVLVVETRSL